MASGAEVCESGKKETEEKNEEERMDGILVKRKSLPFSFKTTRGRPPPFDASERDHYKSLQET